ncbi:MAG TPA: hypothetical protein VMS43_09550 [Allosphingosinicella sp.]|nr:hypothetical protein [Allosphingosinicella sp.]
MKLHRRHLGGIGVAAVAAALAAAVAGFVTGGINAAIFPYALVIAGLHVGLFAMPLFNILLFLGLRPSLPAVLIGAFLIGLIPLSLITGVPSLWAGAFGMCGGYAFWRAIDVPALRENR